MKLSDLEDRLGMELVRAGTSSEATGAFTSDLLSDVVANAKGGDLLITIQAHKNTVAVASLVGIPAIVVCSGHTVPTNMDEAAAAEGIGIYRTPHNQFETSVAVYPLLTAATGAD